MQYKFGNKVGNAGFKFGNKTAQVTMNFGNKTKRLAARVGNANLGLPSNANQPKQSDLEKHHNALSATHRMQG